MGWLKTTLLIALTLSFASVLEAAEIVAMRAYEHKQFHRLTIILSGDISLTADKQDEKVVLKMRELTTKSLKELPGTEAIKVKGLKSETDEKGAYSALEVAIPVGSKVTQTVKAGPFRVILDVFPPADFGKNRPVDPFMKAVLLEQDAPRVMAFNDSWRWVYRKKILDTLRADLYDDASGQAFKAALDIEGGNRNTISVEAAKAGLTLKAEGRAKDAALLDSIMLFYSGQVQPIALENALRAAPDSSVKALGHFLLAEHFERKGFFPESAGYYNLAAGGAKTGPLRSLAMFRKARLLFFDHKYADAKEKFRKAMDEGLIEARAWYASSCLIRGEIDLAWDILANGRVQADGLDPINRLGFADMLLLKGNFQEARFIFASLRSRYPKEGFVGSYLLMREVDAYFLEGKRTEALELYAKSKEKLKGEPWAITSLALADAYFVTGTREELEKAEKIFEAVALGGYEGSAITNMRLVATRMALGHFKDGYEDIKRFHASYPTSPLRQDMNRLSQTLFYGWIDLLTKKGDHVGAVKLFSETPLSIPFGKKAEVSLKIGKSYSALGLFREAVRNLEAVVKIGNEQMAEEAMLLLANVYLDQRDTGSAERLMKAFSTRFPKTKKTAEVEQIYSRIAFANKDYARSAQANAGADPKIASIKADSLARTGKAKEASATFESAARAYESKGEKGEAKGAWLRSADAKFSTGDYSGAAEAYRKGLEIAGQDDRENRSWALYRLAKCYSKLDMKDREADALKELKAVGGQYSYWSEKIFEEAKSL